MWYTANMHVYPVCSKMFTSIICWVDVKPYSTQLTVVINSSPSVFINVLFVIVRTRLSTKYRSMQHLWPWVSVQGQWRSNYDQLHIDNICVIFCTAVFLRHKHCRANTEEQAVEGQTLWSRLWGAGSWRVSSVEQALRSLHWGASSVEQALEERALWSRLLRSRLFGASSV